MEMTVSNTLSQKGPTKDGRDIRLDINGLKILQRTRLEHNVCGKSVPCVEELVVDWTPKLWFQENLLAIKVMWALEPFDRPALDGVPNPVFHFTILRSTDNKFEDNSPVPNTWLQMARQKIAKEFDRHWGFDLVQGLFTGLRHK